MLRPIEEFIQSNLSTGDHTMNFAQTLLLGAIAGFTIYLGLPAGRIKRMPEKTRSFLSMSSVGILLFLFFDIFGQLSDPIETALTQRNIGAFSTLLILSIIGFGISILGFIFFEQRFTRLQAADVQPLSPTQMALMIATGIELHNFSEGLVIGQSSARGEFAFATILIVGFGLHNATEGFGIVGPLAGVEKPTWGFLGLVGLIGGGPTFLGTIVGYYFISASISVLFLSLAAGALLYVIAELFRRNWIKVSKVPAGWGLLAGLLIAYLTDLVLVFAGA